MTEIRPSSRVAFGLSIGRVCLFVLWSMAVAVAADGPSAGPLVIVGGGGTPPELVKEMVQMAGGNAAKVVVLPQASESDGSGSVEMFREAGATEVAALSLEDNAEVESRIKEAKLIWFPGGQQSRLVEKLTDAGLIALIRRRHRDGTVIGGTSAGAAAMSEVMIPRAPKQQTLVGGNTPISKGIGLAPDLIVDQHFVRRSRMNRLLGAVIDHPDRVGVGIGERTAIVYRAGSFEVRGEGSVVVIDSRKSKTLAEEGKLQSARNIQVHVLRSGDRFPGKDANP